MNLSLSSLLLLCRRPLCFYATSVQLSKWAAWSHTARCVCAVLCPYLRTLLASALRPQRLLQPPWSMQRYRTVAATEVMASIVGIRILVALV